MTALSGAVLAAVAIWLAAWWITRNNRLDRAMLRHLDSLGPDVTAAEHQAAVDLFRGTVAGVGPVQLLIEWLVCVRAAGLLVEDAAGAAWSRRARWQEHLDRARREA